MKEYHLFEAIGGVEDRFLEELEQPKLRRLSRHFWLAAALTALLLTACATPAVIRSFDKLQGGRVIASDHDFSMVVSMALNNDGEILQKEERKMYLSGALDIQVTPDADAPEAIETHYLPLRMLELYDIAEYSDEDGLFRIAFTGKAPQNRVMSCIEYRQYVVPADGKITVEDLFSKSTMEESKKQYGNISVLEYNGIGEAVDADNETDPKVWRIDVRYLFWSEGMYLYCLKIPRVYPMINDSDFEEVINSLTPAEDLSDYLPIE